MMTFDQAQATVEEFRRIVCYIARKEDVANKIVFASPDEYPFVVYGHQFTGDRHIMYASVGGVRRKDDGEEKQIEYPWLNYMVEDLGIDTTDIVQVNAHAAVHEAAHVLETEYVTLIRPSTHDELYETILLDLLEKYWDDVRAGLHNKQE